MVLNAKVLGLVAFLGGGGIALPIYLKSQSRGTFLTSPNSAQNVARTSDSRVEKESKSIEKVECSSSEISEDNKDFKDFLVGRQKNIGLYSLVSCTNKVIVGGEEKTLLGKNWTGLFPNHFLKDELSIKTEETFEVTLKTENEEGMPRTVTVTTFSNPKTDSSFRGEWDDILTKTNFSDKRVGVISVQGIKQEPKQVYLLVDSSDTSADDEA